MDTIKNDPDKARQFFEAKMAFTTGPMELNHHIEQGADIVIVDVRASVDYQNGHVPGAINLPKEQWDSLQGLQKDKLNVLYCYSQVCHLAAAAAVAFSSQGYAVMEMEGGYKAWEEHSLRVAVQGGPLVATREKPGVTTDAGRMY